MNEQIKNHVRKWRSLINEGDSLFDVSRQRTVARVKYLQAKAEAEQVMRILERELENPKPQHGDE